jgi:hypothetical protein
VLRVDLCEDRWRPHEDGFAVWTAARRDVKQANSGSPVIMPLIADASRRTAADSVRPLTLDLQVLLGRCGPRGPDCRRRTLDSVAQTGLPDSCLSASLRWPLCIKKLRGRALEGDHWGLRRRSGGRWWASGGRRARAGFGRRPSVSCVG